MYLIHPDQKQYKANLHAHSVLSDGDCTPEELKARYKAQGYSVLAITDHDVPKDHSALSDSDFIMITGYEGYVRPDPSARFDVFAPEIHVNFFARDPHNETMVCYNAPYGRFLPAERIPALKRAGSERPREYTVDYINEYIRTAAACGYLAAYNHPYWSMEGFSRICAYEGLFSMEIYNHDSWLMNHLEYNGALYDQLLLAGKRLFCHATDDNHNHFPFSDPQCDSFGGFTMLMPRTFTYSGLIEAMETGAMYASMGPVIHAVEAVEGTLHIECSPVRHIYAYFGSKRPARVHAVEGEQLTCADLKIDPRAKYVRISIMDEHGKCADTRAWFRDEAPEIFPK